MKLLSENTSEGGREAGHESGRCQVRMEKFQVNFQLSLTPKGAPSLWHFIIRELGFHNSVPFKAHPCKQKLIAFLALGMQAKWFQQLQNVFSIKAQLFIRSKVLKMKKKKDGQMLNIFRKKCGLINVTHICFIMY